MLFNLIQFNSIVDVAVIWFNDVKQCECSNLMYFFQALRLLCVEVSIYIDNVALCKACYAMSYLSRRILLSIIIVQLMPFSVNEARIKRLNIAKVYTAWDVAEATSCCSITHRLCGRPPESIIIFYSVRNIGAPRKN